MKKFLFLAVGILLVLGLVLPGCTGEGPTGADAGYHGLAQDGFLSIGVLGDFDYIQGVHAEDGANLAKTDVGTFTLGTATGITVKVVPVDTNEVDQPGGAAGTAAVTAAIPNCDFMVGGFRTEGVVSYKPLLMAAKMVYIDCGAATQSLAEDVVTSYAGNKYFFRGTPPNDYLLSTMLGKLNVALLGQAEAYYTALHGYGFLPAAAVVAENATWTADPVAITMHNLLEAGISVNGLTHAFYIPSVPANDAQVTGVLATIPANANIIIPILSGPCGITFQNHIRTYFPHALILGINVEAQNSNFPELLTDPSLAEGLVIQDSWVPGVNQTSETASFLSEFAAAYSTQNGGDYGSVPIYTAGTYDAVKSLVDAAISEATMGTITPTLVEWLPDDIVTYLETHVALTAAGNTGYYPAWDGTTTATWIDPSGGTHANTPALNEEQVEGLYPWLAEAKFVKDDEIVDWEYDEADWTMPILASHDLVFASPYDSTHAWATGIASQWQDGEKVCVWPTTDLTAAGGLSPFHSVNTIQAWLATEAGLIASNATLAKAVIEGVQEADLWDQYGWWNFSYPGTGHLDLDDFVLNLP